MEAVREREEYDRLLLVLAVLLIITGTAAILDASFVDALHNKSKHFNGWYDFERQLMWVVPALITLVLGMNVPYWWLRKLWGLGLVVAFVLLIAVMIPHVGLARNGARRWLGFGSLAFQPSEFAKVAVVVFLARYSELWKGRVANLWKGFLPPVVVIFALAGLVAKEDLGTALTLIATGLAMMFMMGARAQHLVCLVLAAMLVATGFVAHKQFRQDRVKGWLLVLSDPLTPHDGPAYQSSQGIIAIGSGGISGSGIMRGGGKDAYIPEAHTDYIFATFGQDVGLIGCLSILVGFAWMVIRGLTIAHRTRDWFGSLLAAGLTCLIGVQAVLNIAVVTALVPTTGVPLPFISYGGSSLVFTTLAVGIILNVSRYPTAASPQ